MKYRSRIRSIDIVCILSLLLSLAVAIIWYRSRDTIEWLEWTTRSGSHWKLSSTNGLRLEHVSGWPEEPGVRYIGHGLTTNRMAPIHVVARFGGITRWYRARFVCFGGKIYVVVDSNGRVQRAPPFPPAPASTWRFSAPLSFWDFQIPYWAAMLPIVPPLLRASVIARRRWLKRYRQRRDLCPVCGYSLVGNTSGTCPECGNAIPAGYLIELPPLKHAWIAYFVGTELALLGALFCLGVVLIASVVGEFSYAAICAAGVALSAGLATFLGRRAVRA